MATAHRPGWRRIRNVALALLASLLVVGVAVSEASRLAAGTPVSRVSRGERDSRQQRNALTLRTVALSGRSGPGRSVLVPRRFAPVVPDVSAVVDASAPSSEVLITPAGPLPYRSLASLPPVFSRALERRLHPGDAVLVRRVSGLSGGAAGLSATLETHRARLLEVRSSDSALVTGVTPELEVALEADGLQLLAWSAGLYTDAGIGLTPVPSTGLAAREELALIGRLLRGGDATAVVDRVRALGGTVRGAFNDTLLLTLNVHVLRDSLDAGQWDGLHLGVLAEAGFWESADEDTSTGIQTGAFRRGHRPYTEAGIDGSTQIIGLTDSGLSLDATVLADGPAGPSGLGTASPAGAGHRKVVSYVEADLVPGSGGLGDGLSCDGTTGATHGHLVASIAAGNASELLAASGLSVCDLNGFEPARSGCATEHAVDGVAPAARIAFIDAQESAWCKGFPLETQTPGLLSAGSEHHAAGVDGVKGTGDDARVHNYALSILGSEASYTVEAQDIDAWLHDNQDYLVVVAAGNRGADSQDIGNLDFGTVTSPGTAKNVVTVGSSGYPNEPLDPDTAVVPGVPNNGIELISRLGPDLGSGQGPAAFTTQAGGTLDWRIKPDVMAPGDENLDNQRLVSPTTCLSGDDDQSGPVECRALQAGEGAAGLPPTGTGRLAGTSYAAAAVTGLAALVRDYFEKGYAPAGVAGGAPENLSGPELKAAIIASAGAMEGNPVWGPRGSGRFRNPLARSGLESLEFYQPKHLAGYTPEQGYGRVQADRLLPLPSEPGSPSFIRSENVTLAAVGSTVVRDFEVLDGDEELTFVAAWYDEAATIAGSGAPGKLVHDVDLEVRDAGDDGVFDTADDTVWFGNYFTEDADFDQAITDIADVFNCSVTTDRRCDPGDDVCLSGPWAGRACGDYHDCDEDIVHVCDVGRTDVCLSGPHQGVACTDDYDCTETIRHDCVFDAVGTGCGNTNDPGLGAESCLITFPAADEDCNENGVLDSSLYSLPVTGQNCIQLPGDEGARDRNNSSEKARLAPSQLVEGHRLRVSLTWARREPGATDTSIEVGLVAVGAFRADGAPDRVRLDRAELSCADAVHVRVLDGAGDADPLSVVSDLTLRSWDCGDDGTCAGIGAADDTILDQVQALAWTELSPGTRYESLPVAVVDAASVPVQPGDRLLSVVNGGRVEAIYGAPDTATATATVRCTPAVEMLNLVRRGTDAGFNLRGGCDPRDRIDPRMVVFGLVPGTGLNVTGDLFLDAGEQLVYEVAFASREDERVLQDIEVSLEACEAGSILPDGTCTPAAAIRILDGVQPLGVLQPGKTQTARFNLRVSPSAAFPSQVEMRFGVTSAGNGLTRRSETVFHHVLDTDTWSRPDESPAVSGVYNYSTDFPTGGQEIRNLAGELFDPLNPDLQAELFVFQDATTTAHGGGNAVLGDALTGQNCDFAAGDPAAPNCVANNWPWTFDRDDEGFRTRRRFDSDAGDNEELAAAPVWQHNTDGACGFQSNAGVCAGGADAGLSCESNADCDSGVCNTVPGSDGEGGQGGIWHTGHTRANDPSGAPACLDGSDPSACARTGYDLGCEDHDIPFTVAFTFERKFVLDVLSSPQLGRVHRNVDTNGFAYTLTFTRLAANLQSSLGDGNTIIAGELDPDTTTPVPVDPLDLGWLFSDQGADGFLTFIGAAPYLVFNPNDTHDPTSASAIGLPLVDTSGPGQTVREVHGPGSSGSFFDPDDTAKAPSRSFGEVVGVLTGRGLASPDRRGAGGLPVRNRDLGLAESSAATFEDIFGPNQARAPAQSYPIDAGNPEVLLSRRDTFQANFIAFLREDPDPSVAAVPDYGAGIDDVVVEWRESHPVADRTPCADPSTWVENDAGNPAGGASVDPSLAAGCAQVAWDRTEIAESETALTLTVIDVNAQFGPDGIDQPDDAPDDDDQARDRDQDGFAELEVRVFSDADLAGEWFTLEQTAFVSPVYRAVVGVSASTGLSSSRDGIIFVQTNGAGTNPGVLTAIYGDEDINVAGAGLPVPCPDNPLLATARTTQTAANVMFVSARVTDETGDLDSIPDDNETVRLDVSVVATVRDITGAKVDLEDVTLTLTSDDPDVGCILDGQAYYGDLSFGAARANPTSDPFRFVVGEVNRTDPQAVLQAEFTLGIRARFTDSLGATHRVAAFVTPQRVVLNLDLDTANDVEPVLSDRACVGGDVSGAACPADGVCSGGLEDGVGCDLSGPGACETGGGTCTDACPGVQGDGVTPAACEPLPEMFRAGGEAFVAGQVSYFEGFEGAPNMAGRNFAGAEPIPGTRFDHLPALNADGGFLERAVRDWIQGGAGVLGGLSNPSGVRSMPGNEPDDPEGSSAVDGVRCQFNDPRGPNPGGRSESQCRPWDGSEWHVNDNKAFHGTKSLYGGVNGEEDLNLDISYDTHHTNLLAAAFTPPLNVGVSGGATLSFRHIIKMFDDRVPGNAIGRGYVMGAVVDPVTGIPTEGGWVKLSGFQNGYVLQAQTPFFINCLFDPYDDFYVSPFKVTGTGIPKNPWNQDDVSSEDDYFDPNDPERRLGPSSGCFPEFVFSSMGNYSSNEPLLGGREDVAGETGETGTGVWVESLFNLDRFAGKSIRIRWVQTEIDIFVGLVWADLFGNRLGDRSRGWRLDDVAVTGLVDTPPQLIADVKAPPPGVCPGDGAPACGELVADAGADAVTPVTGAPVTLSAAASSGNCADGVLLYRWRAGAQVLAGPSTQPALSVSPTTPAVFTVDVTCSTGEGACTAGDTVLVTPADQLAISGPETGPLTVERAGAGPEVTIRGSTPAGTEVIPLTVRADLQRGGMRLADALDGVATDDVVGVAAVLKSGSCGLSIAAPNPAPPGSVVEITDGLTALTVGDVAGYLQYPVTATGLGAWGALNLTGPASPSARGSLDPTALGFPSGTFAELSGLPPGTGGNCGP